MSLAKNVPDFALQLNINKLCGSAVLVLQLGVKKPDVGQPDKATEVSRCERHTILQDRLLEIAQ